MQNENVVHAHSGILFSCEGNDIMKFEGKWIDLENTTLSEVSQTHKDRLACSPCMQILTHNVYLYICNQTSVGLFA